MMEQILIEGEEKNNLKRCLEQFEIIRQDDEQKTKTNLYQYLLKKHFEMEINNDKRFEKKEFKMLNLLSIPLRKSKNISQNTTIINDDKNEKQTQGKQDQKKKKNNNDNEQINKSQEYEVLYLIRNQKQTYKARISSVYLNQPLVMIIFENQEIVKNNTKLKKQFATSNNVLLNFFQEMNAKSNILKQLIFNNEVFHAKFFFSLLQNNIYSIEQYLHKRKIDSGYSSSQKNQQNSQNIKNQQPESLQFFSPTGVQNKQLLKFEIPNESKNTFTQIDVSKLFKSNKSGNKQQQQINNNNYSNNNINNIEEGQQIQQKQQNLGRHQLLGDIDREQKHLLNHGISNNVTISHTCSFTHDFKLEDRKTASQSAHQFDEINSSSILSDRKLNIFQEQNDEDYIDRIKLHGNYNLENIYSKNNLSRSRFQDNIIIQQNDNKNDNVDDCNLLKEQKIDNTNENIIEKDDLQGTTTQIDNNSKSFQDSNLLLFKTLSLPRLSLENNLANNNNNNNNNNKRNNISNDNKNNCANIVNNHNNKTNKIQNNDLNKDSQNSININNNFNKQSQAIFQNNINNDKNGSIGKRQNIVSFKPIQKLVNNEKQSQQSLNNIPKKQLIQNPTISQNKKIFNEQQYLGLNQKQQQQHQNTPPQSQSGTTTTTTATITTAFQNNNNININNNNQNQYVNQQSKVPTLQNYETNIFSDQNMYISQASRLSLKKGRSTLHNPQQQQQSQQFKGTQQVNYKQISPFYFSDIIEDIHMFRNDIQLKYDNSLLQQKLFSDKEMILYILRSLFSSILVVNQKRKKQAHEFRIKTLQNINQNIFQNEQKNVVNITLQQQSSNQNGNEFMIIKNEDCSLNYNSSSRNDNGNYSNKNYITNTPLSQKQINDINHKNNKDNSQNSNKESKNNSKEEIIQNQDGLNSNKSSSNSKNENNNDKIQQVDNKQEQKYEVVENKKQICIKFDEKYAQNTFTDALFLQDNKNKKEYQNYDDIDIPSEMEEINVEFSLEKNRYCNSILVNINNLTKQQLISCLNFNLNHQVSLIEYQIIKLIIQNIGPYPLYTEPRRLCFAFLLDLSEILNHDKQSLFHLPNDNLQQQGQFQQQEQTILFQIPENDTEISKSYLKKQITEHITFEQ